MAQFRRVQIEDSEIIILSDGAAVFPGEMLMVGIGEDERASACERWNLDPVAVRTNLNCVLIRRSDRTLLFDTGAGSSLPGCGKLIDSMNEAGIAPDSIDVVVHSHLHLDHVGGNVDSDGTPAFPNAKHYLGQVEWEFWSRPETLVALEQSQIWKLPNLEPSMGTTVRDNVLAIRDRITVFSEEEEPVPGVRAIPTFGHTPGHLVFLVDLGTESMLITGDLVLSPIHVDRATWFPAVDLDPEAAVSNRARIFNLAVENRYLVAGYHLPFPGLGRLSPTDQGWAWEPEFG